MKKEMKVQVNELRRLLADAIRSGGELVNRGDELDLKRRLDYYIGKVEESIQRDEKNAEMANQMATILAGK